MHRTPTESLTVKVYQGKAQTIRLAPDQRSDLLLETRAVIIESTSHLYGCSVTSRGEEVDLPGENVTLVDAVGAGDAFTAAFLMLTLEGRPLELKARFANRVGALVVGHAGAMPPVAEQYRQLRSEFGI